MDWSFHVKKWPYSLVMNGFFLFFVDVLTYFRLESIAFTNNQALKIHRSLKKTYWLALQVVMNLKAINKMKIIKLINIIYLWSLKIIMNLWNKKWHSVIIAFSLFLFQTQKKQLRFCAKEPVCKPNTSKGFRH